MFRLSSSLTALALALAAPGTAFSQAPQVNCAQDFMALRTAAEAGGKSLQEAGKRKATPAELCPLFRKFGEAEARLVRFLEQNQTWCQVPPEMVKTAKANHARTIQLRTRVCQAATAPAPAPLSPSFGLSGALDARPFGGPPPPATSGTGVFDTLTGNVLQR
jgi:hypothetical protein